MTIVYPAYIAAFITVGERYPRFQSLVTLLIPPLKMMLRQIMFYIIADWEDLIPIITIFSVEFFGALYQVVCVQSGLSPLTTAAIMAIDFFHAVWGQWKLHSRTKSISQLLESSQSLLLTVSAMCDSPTNMLIDRTTPRKRIPLRSTLRHCGLSKEGQRRLRRLRTLNIFDHDQWVNLSSSRSTRPRSDRWHKTLLSTVAVAPTPTAESSDRTENHALVLVEAAAMLYISEYLLLGEYVECIIPLVYAASLTQLWASPNAAYYPHTRAMSSFVELCHTLANIGALFVLETASFLILCVALWRRMRFSPMHQLSYVLEHQASVSQSCMTVFLVLSLLFNLDHVGADYSFQFKWLKR